MRHLPLTLKPCIQAFQQCCSRLFTLVFGLLICVACSAQAPKASAHRWTEFVPVEGQPEPVPTEWVATPEGKFAHTIKTPNPLTKDSGYRPGMTSAQYFEHLCQTEGGDFVFKTVENVEGLYFMRPLNRPTDTDLMDRYKLEAPGIERTFQLRRAIPEERAKIFVNPPWARFSFTEEPNHAPKAMQSYLRIYGYRQDVAAMKVEAVDELKSRYGLLWRGLKRPHDRELNIAGSEWIVLDVTTNEVLAVQRDYARTGLTRNTPEGIWWLNASNCPGSAVKHIRGSQIYDFVTKSLKPAVGDK